MQTKDKTYSFRAATDLAPRVEAARRYWSELVAVPASEVPQSVLQEFHRRLALAFAQLENSTNQSTAIRSSLEIFVAATERMRDEIELAREYEAWSQQDSEGEEWRAGAMAAASELWDDE